MHRLSIYSPMRKWKKGDPVGPPSVYLSLGSYQERDGRIFLSAHDLTPITQPPSMSSLLGFEVHQNDQNCKLLLFPLAQILVGPLIVSVCETWFASTMLSPITANNGEAILAS